MAPVIVNGETRLYGIIGNPVSHSFSPAMHTLGFQQLGINAVYLPFPQQERNLDKLLDAFSITGVQGFNVTVPFKEKIIPYLDLVEDQARLIGSVNTVIKTGLGWEGSSTDGEGFVRSILEQEVSLPGSRVLLLGAGGSAKAIAMALVQHKIKTLHIRNRTSKKARELGKLCQRRNPGLHLKINSEDEENYDLLINCTTLGMSDNSCPVSDRLIKQSGFIADIIYNPIQTQLLKKADHFNIPNCNGIGMLLYQGIVSFEIWSGKSAPVEVMRESLLNSLKEH